MAGRFARHPAEAEDIAQEAMLRAWRMRHTCRTPHRSAWVRQIAVNEALRQRERRTPDLLAEPAHDAASPERELEDTVQRVDVGRALMRLDAQDREIVALRYAGDQTQPAIAEKLRMPEGTVKIRLHRARKRLREGLNEY